MSSLESKILKKPLTAGIVAAGFSGGQAKGGVEHGPSRLIDAGLETQLENLGWKVVIDASIPLNYESLRPAPSDTNLVPSNTGPPKLKNVKYVSSVTQNVFKNVSDACKAGHLALTLGGDHSLAIGTISGSLANYPDLGVLWVDAHADINTPATTTSGNLHGCPLSFLTGKIFLSFYKSF